MRRVLARSHRDPIAISVLLLVNFHLRMLQNKGLFQIIRKIDCAIEHKTNYCYLCRTGFCKCYLCCIYHDHANFIPFQ